MTGIVALLAFRDEAERLPGYFENIRGRVDGVIALDDGSADGGPAIVAGQPETLDLLSLPRADWDEPRNRGTLIRAGQATGAEWLLAIDADERLEDGFWRDADGLLEAADRDGVLAVSFRLRELWDRSDRFRVDGVWGRKRKAALFRNVGADHIHDAAAWHGEWVPMQAWGTPACRPVPYDLYHLKMIRRPERAARRARYERVDPDARHQTIGYAYLTDERGLETTGIEAGRGYRGGP